MAANTRKRGKSESLRRHISIRPPRCLSVCPFIRPRGVPCCRPQAALKRPHPRLSGPRSHAASSSHLTAMKSAHYVWLSSRSLEVTNGGVEGRWGFIYFFSIPGATSRKLILYRTTNTCIPLASGCRSHGGGELEAAAARWRVSWGVLWKRVLFHWLQLTMWRVPDIDSVPQQVWKHHFWLQ